MGPLTHRQNLCLSEIVHVVTRGRGLLLQGVVNAHPEGKSLRRVKTKPESLFDVTPFHCLASFEWPSDW